MSSSVLSSQFKPASVEMTNLDVEGDGSPPIHANLSRDWDAAIIEHFCFDSSVQVTP